MRLLLPHLRRHRGRYLAGLALTAVSALAGAAGPLVIRRAVGVLERGEAASQVVAAVLGLLGLAAIRSVFVFGGRFVVLSASRAIEYELRNELYARLLKLPAAWFDRHPTGDIMSRFINDLEGVRLMAGIGLQQIAGTGLIFLTSLAGMFIIDWRLALICLVPLSLLSIVMVVTNKPMQDRSLRVQDQLGVVSARAQENFTGARVVKAFAREETEAARFDAECATYLRENVGLARLRGLTWALLSFFMELAIAVTLYVGGAAIIGGSFSFADLSAFTAYQFMLVWPMIAIGWVITIFQRGIVCLGRLSEILDAPGTPSGPREPEIRGAIEARNLSFRYAEDRPPALDGVSFSIAPGEKIGIVGRTGSGKSTLASLLLKLHPAPPGTLFIDGCDLNELSTERLRRATSSVPQDPFLFSDTLRNNIGFGSLDGQADADIDRAARLSRIAGDAERFPGKLDQVVGERGVTLSGGQKQRTALARALLRRPAILVLDDALSSVDAHTEREILGELREFMKGRTSLVITHRIGAVMDADRILVMDAGRIAESGTHAELVARGGLYAGMVRRQQLIDEIEAPGVR